MRDGSRIHAAILAAVSDHGDGDHLKIENVYENTSARDFYILCGGVVKSVILLMTGETISEIRQAERCQFRRKHFPDRIRM